MITADTSTIIAYLRGDSGSDVEILLEAFRNKQLLMLPIVLTELLSDSGISPNVSKSLNDLPRVELTDGFWERAATLRAKILDKGLKCRLADALIAQLCKDHELAIITRDKDFRHFEKFCQIKILK